jgi:hypothetical protein
MRQIEVINQETIIDVTAETSNVEILVRDYDSELVERFALEAQEAAIDAEESADIATAQASIATAQATIATTQAGIATTQAGIATTQAGIATTKANEASASAASALASEQAADSDRIAAQTAASTATTQAGIATTQAGIATTKAGEASASAAAALASETDAETAASTATTQAGIATTQAGIATTQAGIATTQAGNALTSANNAAASAAAAAQVGTSTPLTGFSTGANSTILATDTILQGFNKTQGQINARVSGTIATGQVAFGTATNTVGGDAGLTFNNTTKILDIARNDRALGAELRLTNSFNGSGWLAGDIIGTLNFYSTDASTTQPIRSQIQAINLVGSSYAASMALIFSTANLNTLTEGFRLTNTSNLLVGTTTDSGFRLDINGTARVQGNLNVSTGGITLTGAQTIQTSTGNLTLATAAANGNINLVPNGSGIVDIRSFNDTANTQVATLRFTDLDLSSGTGQKTGRIEFFTSDTTPGPSGVTSFIESITEGTTGLGSLIFGTGQSGSAVEDARFTSNGNFLIGTTTNAGFRLDVNGSTRFNGLSTIQGTTASDSGQLGTELLTTGTGDASWTGTDFATGYTHVAGSTTTLTSTLAGAVNTHYQITYTVTGRTAGSFTIAFGGFTSGNLTATGAVGPQATTTGTLVITPTSDFNGTIVLSIRAIGASSASVTFNNSAGTVTNQIRISSISTNIFIGLNSGRRNTTAAENTFLGSNAGANNTTGGSNCFFGNAAGLSNTTGVNNSFFGRDSGDANTTGNNNCFFGASSGGGNTTGSQNSFFGISAGLGNTTGSQNVSFGQSSSLNNITGSQNVVIGTDAGRFAGAGTTAMTSVDNSIYLGYLTRGLNATGSTNELVIGVNVVGLGSNTTVLGNTSTTHGRWYGSLLLGTTTNAASSILTMESTTQGFLPPRITTTQRNAISSPATGLVVYDNTLNKLSVFTGLVWETVTSL